MSNRASGVLYWGIPYNADELEQIHPYDADGASGANKLSELAWTRRDATMPRAPSEDEGDATWDAWRDHLEAWEAEQCDVGLAGYCDNSEASYVFVIASRLEAQWSQMLAVESLTVPPEWYPRLRTYCEALGLPWCEPGWYLTSYYG